MDKESEVDPPEYLDYTNEELGNTEEVQELETYGREVSEELEGEPVLSGEEDTSVDKDTFESPTPENEQEDEEEVNQSGTIPHEYLVGDVSLGEEDTVLEVSYELQQAEQEEDVEETATEEKQFDIIETVTEKTDEVPLYQETPPPGTPPSPPIDDINLPPEQDTPLSEKFEDLDVMGSTDDNQVPLEDLMTMEDPVVVLEYEDTKVLLADYPPNEDIKVSFDSKVTLETLSTEALLSSEVFFDATPNEIPVVSDVPVQNEVPSSNIDAILSKLSAVNNVSSSSEVLLEESTSSEASNKENTQVTTTNKPMKKKKTARSSSTKQSKIAQTPPARSSLKESPKSLPKVTPKSEPRPESGDRRRSSGKNFQPTVCKPFNFSLDKRVEDRSKFNERMKRQRQAQEERERLEKERQEKEEDERIKELRKTLIHKAQPVRYYDPITVTPSEKPLTIPEAPNLILTSRIRQPRVSDQRDSTGSSSRLKQSPGKRSIL